MTTTRRILAAAALTALASACAQPPAFTPASGPSSSIGPFSVMAENIVIDTGPATNETLSKSLAFHSSILEIEQPGGRPLQAVVTIEDYDEVNGYLRSASHLLAQNSMEGRIELRDPATGETLFVSEVIEVDGRITHYNRDSAVVTRSRNDIQAEKLSKFFMERARQTLLTPNS